MTTGPSNTPLSERLAERRQKQLAELDDVTQRQLQEHESALKQQFDGVRRTTTNAISAHSQSLIDSLSQAEMRQRQHLEAIEKRLATASAQAERLSRVGGLRSWTRPAAITVSVMLTVAGVTAGGLHLTDRLIDSRWERLSVLNHEIQRAESLPRLPQGVDIRQIEGHTYLTGIDPSNAWSGKLSDDTPVIRLTKGD